MPPPISSRLSFVKGVVLDPGHGFIVAAVDEMTADRQPHCVLLEWQAGTFRHRLTRGAYAAGIAQSNHEPNSAILVTEDGEATLIGASAGELRERVDEGLDDSLSAGPLRGVRRVGRDVYAVGMVRRVHKRNAAGEWKLMTAVRGPVTTGEAVAYESIDGFSSDELYAVGWSGAIMWFDGQIWQDVSAPTNVILTDVACADDGVVYACGQVGTLVRGRRDSWSIVDTDELPFDFWSVRKFGSKIYLSSMNGLFAFDGLRFEVVDTSDHSAATFYALTTGGGVLWSIGAKDVVSFDGRSWSRIA